MKQQRSFGSSRHSGPHAALVYAHTEQQQMRLADKLSVADGGDYDLGLSYPAMIGRLGILFVVVIAAIFVINMTLERWL